MHTSLCASPHSPFVLGPPQVRCLHRRARSERSPSIAAASSGFPPGSWFVTSRAHLPRPMIHDGRRGLGMPPSVYCVGSVGLGRLSAVVSVRIHGCLQHRIGSSPVAWFVSNAGGLSFCACVIRYLAAPSHVTVCAICFLSASQDVAVSSRDCQAHR